MFRWFCAVLLAAGLLALQALLGGGLYWYFALSIPGLTLLAAAALVAGLLFWWTEAEPGAWCVGSALLFAAYLLWRQSETIDAYAAREDFWLVLGCLCVYLAAAWQVRGYGPRWLILGALFAALVVQVVLAVSQFTADAAFHPFPDLVVQRALPRGGAGDAARLFISGTLHHRTALSGLLGVVTFLALGQLLWGRGGVVAKLLLLWVTACGFLGLTLCLSRSAYLGTAAGLAVFGLTGFFVLRRGTSTHRGWLAAAGLALVALALLLGFAVGRESIAVKLRLGRVGGDEYRETLWQTSVAPMLALEPIFGSGGGMFHQLSRRYRTPGEGGNPVYAHNDWLQLLVEYGAIGLALGALFFLVHFFAGFRNALRLAGGLPPSAPWPQSTELGLATGGIAALSAQTVHAVFDYNLHVPAVALTAALAAGWIAAARPPGLSRRLPSWLRVAAFMPAIPALALLSSLHKNGAGDLAALRAENVLVRGENQRAWDLASTALQAAPEHARLMSLAGEAARELGTSAADARRRAAWLELADLSFATVLDRCPLEPVWWRERALVLDLAGRPDEALPLHLRAIARDPDFARSYQYLALHYQLLGRPEAAARLWRLTTRLPNDDPELTARNLERLEAVSPPAP